MNLEARISDLIQGAYNAVPGGNWAPFLTAYTRAFGADSAWLVRLHSETKSTIIDHHVGTSDEFMSRLELHQSGAVELYGDALGRLPVGRVHHFNGLVDESVSKKTSFYNDFVASSGYHLDGNACIFRRSDQGIEGLAVHYESERDESLIPTTHHLQERVVPHIIAARALERRITQAERDRQGLLMALDSHDCAVVSCDGLGRVRVVSRAARAIFDAQDGLAYRDGRVTAFDIGSRARLDRAISQACLLSRRGTDEIPEPIEIKRKGGALTYEVVVCPVPESHDALQAENSRILLFIDDPSQRPATDDQFLQSRFSLTRQEAHVARLLVQGNSPTEVADLLFVSRETVKSHTKAIYIKTGTRRHADLCARLLSGLRRIRR